MLLTFASRLPLTEPATSDTALILYHGLFFFHLSLKMLATVAAQFTPQSIPLVSALIPPTFKQLPPPFQLLSAACFSAVLRWLLIIGQARVELINHCHLLSHLTWQGFFFFNLETWLWSTRHFRNWCVWAFWKQKAESPVEQDTETGWLSSCINSNLSSEWLCPLLMLV